MNITITAQSLITAAAVLSAVLAIAGVVFAVYRWYLKQNKQNDEIKKIKTENTLICYGLSAALDGLIQLGANHSVTMAKEKLDKHLNQQAHE
uniref:Branched-chain amino acid ABC transporter permease n=1 Tax=Siphoviridae sp. ctkyH28 TaxID=2827585 RepID=A0A8S5LMT0_9CAUD|nr:MAG TPA: hypothetical protein [Siphoviridae sp. ctkyH28]